MPTTRTVAIKASGGDYTSATACIAAEKGDMVALDRKLVVEQYASAGAQGAVHLSDTDWNTSLTCDITWTFPVGERHTGKWDSAKGRFAASAGGAPMFRVDASLHVTLEYFQVENSAALSTAPSGIYIDGAGAGYIRINNPIARLTGSTAGADGGTAPILLYGTGAYTVEILNPLTIGGQDGIAQGAYNPSGMTVLIYNPTCIDNVRNGIYLFGQDGGTQRVKNALIQLASGASGVAWHAGFPATTSYAKILTSDATSPHSGLRNKTVTFVDAGAGDYTPASGDTEARDQGDDLSADPFLPHSTDLAGATRSGTWDIGALEYIAPGGGGSVGFRPYYIG